LQAGEYVHLLGIRAKPEAPLRFIAIGELIHVYRAGYLKMFGVDPGASVTNFINSHEEKRAQRMLYIDAFLGEVLSDTKAHLQNYRASRAVAAVAYQAIPEAEGFYYPSVRTAIGTNVTMKTGTYDQKFRVVASRLIQIQTPRLYDFYEHEVRREAIALSTDGTFIWGSPTPAKETFFNLTKEEFDALMQARKPSK